MEFYHNQLRLRLLNEDNTSAYQRADWLVDKLGTTVHAFFWLDEYSEKEDFSRYRKDEWASGLTSWRNALKIPDSDVKLEGKFAKITSQTHRDIVHIVWNPGSLFSLCDCNWADMGYLCEHVFKVIKVCRERGSALPSIGLFQYKRALLDMLHCPPHDSLVRDHAISLAVFVEKQLSSLIDEGSSNITDKPQSNRVFSEHPGGDLVEERNENSLSSSDGHNCVDMSETPGRITENLGGHVTDMTVKPNGFCNETGKENYGKMDVDGPSICSSTPRLLHIVEAPSNGFVLEKRERDSISKTTDVANAPSLDGNDLADFKA